MLGGGRILYGVWFHVHFRHFFPRAGNTEDVLELEDPFFKCVEVMISSDPKKLDDGLEYVKTFMGLTGTDTDETQYAINLLKGLKQVS